MKLEGRMAIITGASRGLGKSIAEAFREVGAIVYAPDRQQCQKLDLTGGTWSKWPIILVNNAGIYGPIGPTESVDWDEWVETLATNLLLSVQMCRAVVPTMRARGYGKIIQISGGGATKPMPNMSAYAASKAAVVRFAETLAEELRGTGVEVNSLAPGVMNTRLLDQVIAAGPEAAGEVFHQQMVSKKAEGGDDIKKATDLAVFLASADSDGITGKLISAQWDEWPEPYFQRRMKFESDFLTLRRMVDENEDG